MSNLMTWKSLWILCLFTAIVGVSSNTASASVLVNIDLSGATVGQPIPTAPFGANPVTAYTSFGGFDSPLGTGLVQNVAGIGKAADLKTYNTNDQVGALYLDTSLNIAAPELVLSFDINILNQAATGYGQTVDGGATPLLFGLRLYSSSSAQWATTFNVAPTSTTTGVFGFRDATNSTLQTFGTYTVGTAEHVQLNVDYINGTADAYINGNLAYSGYPLRTGIAPDATTNEMFMYLNGSAGTANEVAIGNVMLQSVPLPASMYMGVGLLAVLGFGRWYRGRISTAV
jgi:hypothetical protein